MQFKTAICKDVIRSYHGTHVDIANVFFNIYSEMFTVQIQNNKPVLYQRQSIEKEWQPGHILHIKRLLSTTIYNLYCRVALMLFNSAFNDDDELIKPKNIDIAISLLRIATQLKNETFKNHIVKAIIEKMTI